MVPRSEFAILISLLATLAIVAAPQYAPTVSVSPSSGPPGTTVTVNGSGFAAGFKREEFAGTAPRRDSFTMPGSGSFSRSISVPGGAGAGGHTISACNYCGGGEFEESASAGYHRHQSEHPDAVVHPHPHSHACPGVHTGPPRPRSHRRRHQPSRRPYAGDLRPGPGGGGLRLRRRGAHLVDESISRNSAAIEAPTTVRPHSGALAARSQIGMEFGSALRPITLVLTPKGACAVGMFVGLDSAEYVDSEVTAVLRAFGYVGNSLLMTPLGSGSVSFAPAPTDIKHCLVFHAGDNEVIGRLELEYTDAAGSTLADPRSD